MASQGAPLTRRLLAPLLAGVCAALGAAVGAALGVAVLQNPWVAVGLATLGALFGSMPGVLLAIVLAPATPPVVRAMAQARQGERPAGDDADAVFLREMTERLQQNADLTVKLDEQLFRTRKAEAKLMAATMRADEAQRARTAFLTRMSHELRTPLNAVIGYAELVSEELDDEGLKGDLHKVRRAGLHLQGLVTSILDLTQLESGRMAVVPERIDFSELVQQIADGARNEAENNHNRIELQVDRGATGMLDRRLVSSILFNLVHNAVKYTTRGTITIRVMVGERLTLFVGDTGIGMTPRQLAQATVPFAQADESTTRAYDGSGLGLAICKGFAEAMGGSLSIESTVGKGARVTVDLPRVTESHQPPDDEDPEEETMLLR